MVDNNLSTCLIQCNFVQKSTGPVPIKTKEPSSRIGKLQVINFTGTLTFKKKKKKIFLASLMAFPETKSHCFLTVLLQHFFFRWHILDCFFCTACLILFPPSVSVLTLSSTIYSYLGGRGWARL